MQIDEVITTLRAAAFTEKFSELAAEAGMSDDQLRRVLSEVPPGWVEKVRCLQLAAVKRSKPTAPGAAETGGSPNP